MTKGSEGDVERKIGMHGQETMRKEWQGEREREREGGRERGIEII